MVRPPRWTIERIRDGVGVVHLSSWTWFADFVRQHMLDAPTYVWRGQTDARWKLEPTLDRILRGRGLLHDAKIRAAHLRRFKLSTRGRRPAGTAPMLADNEWWALGQHYGLATPLLDWTTSPFVAAYFAWYGENTTRARRRAVFALGRRSVERKSAELAGAAANGERPPVIEFLEPPSDENARLVSQGGLFTRAPDGVTVEEWVRRWFAADARTWRLLKITIPDADRTMALKTLNRMNINHRSLYPDLYGASQFANVDLRIDNY